MNKKLPNKIKTSSKSVFIKEGGSTFSSASFLKIQILKAFFFIVLVSSVFSIRAQVVLIPFTGSTSVPCGSNVALQAHNGTSGTYSINADGYVVLNATYQASITIAGTFTTEAGYDYIRIYDGVGIGGALLATYSGQNMSMSYVGTPGQTLTVRFNSDGSVVYAGFNLNVTYAGTCYSVACTGTPSANSISPANFTTCPGLANNPSLSLANTYQLNSISYQWQASTTSAAGLYTAIPGATLSTAPVPTLGVTTWYQAIVTCTNGGGIYYTPPTQFFVAGQTTNTIPYYEGFEGVYLNNRLPNCSWYAPNIITSVNTYTAAASNNRLPRTGNNFASFGLPSTNNMVYSNGLTMSPGITYSAALWYATEYLGNTNWTSLSILVGPNQSTTGLVPIATVSPAVSGSYKLLSGVFTVPSAGNYYIAIQANATNGSALYLSWDDLSVTIPCYGLGASNSLTIGVTASSQTICTGDALNLTASGASTYSWSTGATTSGITDNPFTTGINNYVVTGTNAVTGCTASVVTPVLVNPSPLVGISASPATVCVGQPVVLTALGNANSYLWSNSGNSSVITVTTNAPATYTVIGTGTNGCISSAVQAIAIYNLPVVTANSSIPDACKDDVITLTALGATNYQWVSNTSGNVLQGSTVNVTLGSSSIFTVTGTNSTNGCFAKSTLVQNINDCTGIDKYTAASGVKVYPNPTSGEFTVEFNSASLKTIEVMDLTGRVIQSNTSTDQSVLVNMSTVANGIYYVKVISTDNVDVIKVVKQ